MKNKTAIALMALLLGLATPAMAQTCPGCIQNSATPQNAQMNIGTATVRGTLTASTGTFIWINAMNLAVDNLSGNGSAITSLNASQLTSGVLAAARLVGQYTGITGVGTLVSGVWNGTIIGTQYGGTGNNWSTKTVGHIPYFSTTGAMNTLAPGDSGKILQSNGAAAPSWTGAPSVLGTNITSIPLANLQTGALPSAIAVGDASLTAVSAAKVSGNIAGGAATLTSPLPVNNLAAGTLSTSNPASSITASGVAAGTYGGPTQMPQIHVNADGRIDSASQSLLAVPPANISTGAIPAGVTLAAASVSTGTLHDYVVASSITATGVAPGSYGDATRTVTLAVRSDGRLATASQQLIAINTNQINAGALPGSVTVPAASITSGTLATNVTATKVANSGVSAGTYGGIDQIPQISIGADGRVTSAVQFTIPALSTTAVGSNVDNNWSHAQTSQSSWTFNAPIQATNITGTNFSGSGAGLTSLNPGAISAGSLPSNVIASSVSIFAVSNKLDKTGTSALAITGSAGTITTQSSVTASAFFGDGSALTGIPTSTNAVQKTGDTMTGQLTNTSTITILGNAFSVGTSTFVITGGNIGAGTNSPTQRLHVVGNILGTSSVTASAFFGDGSALTGITATACSAGGGTSSALCQGSGNTAGGNFSSVGGGQSNAASGLHSTVGGGHLNTASLDQTTVGGGNGNTASNNGATVSGGDGNTSSGFVATIGGGSSNISSGTAAAVGGGQSNTANGADAVIGGGESNSASGSHAVIGGGMSNSASNTAATLSGGQGNVASGLYSTLSGGLDNDSTNDYAVIGGGRLNTASGQFTTVGGGSTNTADTTAATVAGGQSNTASSGNATVGGGANNVASNDSATVGGGNGNKASGISSTVPGGQSNEASGLQSLAAGNRAKASAQGSFVWADSQASDLLGTTTDQFLIRAQGGFSVNTSSMVVTLSTHNLRYEDATGSPLLKNRGFTGTGGNVAGGVYTTDHSRGTPAVPLATGSGDLIGVFGGRPFDGTTITQFTKGSIRFLAEENTTPTAQGTRAEFTTTAIGTTAGLTRMTIKGSGDVGIGTTSPAARLHITTATASTALYVDSGNVYIGSNSLTAALPLNVSTSAAGFSGMRITNLGGATGGTAVLFMQNYNDANTNGNSISSRRARGTSTAPLAVNNGDDLLSMIARGFAVTDFSTNAIASVSLQAAGTFTDNSNPTRFIVATTNSGAITQRSVATWEPNGDMRVGIGATISTFSSTGSLTLAPGAVLTLNGGNLATDSTGFYVASKDTITFTLDGSRMVEIRQFNNIGSSNSLAMLGTYFAGSAPVGTGMGYIGRAARGSAEAPVALTTGDSMVAIGGLPFDGTNFRALTSVRQSAVAEEPQTPTAQGGGWIWDTTAIGGITRTQKMVLKGNGNLGLGTASPSAKLVIAGTDQVGVTTEFDFHGSSVAQYGSVGAVFQGRGFNGTFAAPTAYTNGKTLVAYGGSAFDGSVYPTGVNVTPAYIAFTSSGTWSTANHGSYATIGTNAIDSSSSTERVRITDGGNMGIGTSTPQAKLDVNGSASFGSDATKSTFTAAGSLIMGGATRRQVRTKAQFDTITPVEGDEYTCSDCTVPFDICTATAPTLSGFRAVLNSAINTVTPGTLVSKGCGTNE